MNRVREKHLLEMEILKSAINSNGLSEQEKDILKLRLKKMEKQLELFDKEMGVTMENKLLKFMLENYNNTYLESFYIRDDEDNLQRKECLIWKNGSRKDYAIEFRHIGYRIYLYANGLEVQRSNMTDFEMCLNQILKRVKKPILTSVIFEKECKKYKKMVEEYKGW